MKSKITKNQIFKRGIAVALILILALFAIANMFEVSNAAVSGIQKKLKAGEDTIEISNEEKLRALAKIVNEEKNNLEGVTIILTDNITLSEEEWTPIGDETTPFQGNFDGNGKAINNLTYNKEKHYNNDNVGLFGVIGEKGEVKNLITNNFSINLPADINADLNSETTTEGVKNVRYANAGNIAGKNYGYIRNCINMYSGEKTSIIGGSCVGGLVGYNQGYIEYCTNTVDVIGYDFVGGLVGENNKVIAFSKNTGNVTGTESDIGGLVGALNNAKNEDGTTAAFGRIAYVNNTGNVKGRTRVGGLVGSFGYECDSGALSYYLGEGTVTNDEYGTIDRVSFLTESGSTEAINLISGHLNTGKTNQVSSGVALVDSISGVFNSASGYGWGGFNEWSLNYVATTKIEPLAWSLALCADLKEIRDDITYDGGNKLFGYDSSNKKIILNVSVGADLDTSNLEPTGPVVEPDVVPDYAKEVTPDFAKNEDGTTDASKTWVIYKVSKIDAEGNETVIKEATSLENALDDIAFNAGEKIRVETTYNKLLQKQDGTALTKESDEIPELKIKDHEDKIFTCTGVDNNVANPDTTKTTKVTRITYEYVIEESEQINTDALVLGGYAGLLAIDNTDANLKAKGTDAETFELDIDLSIDAIVPTLLESGMKVYVEEKLKTGRYPAGTEVIFELPFSEVIDLDKSILPEILVSFTESGAGKYNYNIFDGKEGYAKYIGISEDGKTLKYVYKIQEGDEGYLNYDFTAGSIADSAGNIKDILDSIIDSIVLDDMDGVEPFGAEDLGITYKLFKNGTEITGDTEFTKSDKLTVEVKFDKVLYARIGDLNKVDANEIFKNTDLLKSYVPSLYLKNIAAGEAKEIDTNETEKTTTITYEFDLSTIAIINKVINLDKLVLKNDKNKIVNSDGEFNDGTTYYSSEYKEKFDTADKDLYKEIVLDAKKDLNLEDEIIIDLTRDSSSEDPGSEESGYQKIYADTTAPTVEITANTSNPTNADEIEYTFTFSEIVKDFTIDDVTVNGGTKVGDLVVVKEGKIYTLKVKPTVINNEGFVQVIVEKGSCVDLVAKDVIRQEKNITIDKTKSEFKYASIRRDEDKIIIEAVFNENVGEVDSLIPKMYIGGIEKDSEDWKSDVDGNKVIFEYNIDAADGGKVEVTLKGTVKDVAGNVSDEVNSKIENNITLDKTVIRPETGSDLGEGDYYYTFEKNGVSINNFANPTYFTYGDVITVEKHSDLVDGLGLPIPVKTYTYEVKDNMDLTPMKYMTLKDVTAAELLVDPTATGKAAFSTETSEGAIDISAANIFFDTVSPSVELVISAEEKAEGNIYTEGKELIISATTSETIKDSEVPEIQVNFTNSGIGKYNYQEDKTKGNAVLVDTIINTNGSTTWKYKYVVQNGDDGQVIIGYAKEGEIFDLAGNRTELKDYPAPKVGDTNLIDNEITGTDVKISYEFYKNDEKITNFEDNTYFKNEDEIKVVVKFDKILYESIIPENKAELETAPTLAIDGKEFDKESYNETESTTEITYTYVVNGDADELLDNLFLTISGLGVEKTTETGGRDYAALPDSITKNIENCNLHIYNSATIVSGEIKVDTKAPRVSISANTTSPTKANEIIYTFTFNEEVKDFTIDDINVYGGTKDGKLEKVAEKEEYTLKVIPSVAEGNEGYLQVVVADGVCIDLIGLENKGAESTITVDKKSPIFVGLEAFAESNSTIKLNEEVDIVKEYYKAGDAVTIVATFDESVTIDENTKLILQFSESGNAKGETTLVKSVGNKITYTYTLAEGDKGTLSVKAFSGKATDAAGNEMTITKRALDGDTIIADSIAPNLKELNVISPAEGVYKADNEITIEAIFDEEIYVLENNEIKLVNTQIEVTDTKGTETEEDDEVTYTNNVPTLKIQFGNGEVKEATVIGYGTKEDGSVDRTKLVYTYTIVDGDNGKLSIDSYTNKEGYGICDKAGNVAELTVNQTGNEITADTRRPEVTNITAVVEDPIIEGTGIYHKAGNEIKITVEFDEEVSSAVLFPKILVGFSEDPNTEPTTYKEYSYESDWNVNSTTIEYTYEIKEGDNGYLWVKVPENQFKDEAGNGNVEEEATYISNIFADTTDPYLATNKDTNAQWKIEYVKNQDGQVTGIKAIGIFNEEIFSMNDNSLVELNDIPLMGVFINGSLQKTVEVPAVAVEDGKTKLTYEIDITDINTTGTISVNFIDGTVYDRAGNKMSIELVDGDVSSPIFKDIKVMTPNGFYKAEEIIEIVARFEEETKLVTMPTLKVKLGDKELTLQGTYDPEHSENTDTIKVAKYTYKIVDGDNGALNIISLTGKASDGVRTSDEILQVYSGLVGEIAGTADTLKNSQGTTYANNNEEYKNVIADTKKPFVTSVVAKVDGKVIASYTKEEGKDPVRVVGKTNANVIEYTITASEPINNFVAELVDGFNGIINPEDIEIETSTTIKVRVNTTTEGVQSLIIYRDAADDRAGNTNELERFNIVTTDFTKPTVRFISEYNGGVYVLPTNIGRIEVRPNVEISEDIAKIEYKWDNGEYAEIENYSTSSDIAVPTKAFTNAGTHVLYIKVVDLAGNVEETSKTYEILNSSIDVTLSTEEYTNQDVIATVEFGNGLTDNRKVTFKAEGADEPKAIVPNTDGTYTITENGTVYAEATDKVGNKVFTERTITNIDKDAPKVEIALDRADLVIGTNAKKATIKTNVEVTDNNSVESKFAYIQKDIDTNNMNAIDKATISNNLSGEAKKDDADSTKDKTPYYLYVIAVDEAGNETIAKAGPFTVLDTNGRTILEEIFPDVSNPEDGNNEPETVEKPIQAEIEASKLISIKQVGKHIDITYNNFGEGETYLDIIKEKEITLSDDEDGYIDYEYYSYVEVNKPTTITVVGTDACGNQVIATYEVTRESIEGPEFDIYGNPEYWTNQNVQLDVYCYEELSALTVEKVGGSSAQNILENMSYVVEENGDYKFVATDMYGMTSEKVIKVTKIDKDIPTISEAKISKLQGSERAITITAEDSLSGIAEYAITDTTELPVEWSKSNVIKVTHDGVFYVWAKDNAGNIARYDKVVTLDTTAPTIRFEYTLLTVEAGMPMETNVATNEGAIISYSWDKENWVDSEEFITSIKVSQKCEMTGKYTLYAKATDRNGNASEVQTIEFTVIKPEEILDPQVVFEDLPTMQVDGVKYVKVAEDMTTEDVTSKMNQKALCGQTPEYTKLAEGNDLKTGSEITLNGDTKYIVIVNGDVNCDGKVGPIDVTYANSIRLNKANANTIQKLAADFDLDGVVKPIDITMINSYRLGKIKGI